MSYDRDFPPENPLKDWSTTPRIDDFPEKPVAGEPVEADKVEHPFYAMIEDAETLGETVMEAAFDVQVRLRTEAESRAILREVKERLEREEGEVVLEAVINAKAKMGPLAGIATSSSAYKVAQRVLCDEYHERNPTTRKAFELRRMNLERDEINLECAKVFFSAVRNSSTLQAATLNVLSS